MIVKIDGNMCRAMKLQKTNFPKKEYELKLTEVFPVTSMIQVAENSMKGVDSSDDEQESTLQEGIQLPLPVVPAMNHETTTNLELDVTIPMESNISDVSTEDVSTEDVSTQDVSSEDLDATATPDVPTSEVEYEESTSSRPKRRTRRPAHLGDYECLFR